MWVKICGTTNLQDALMAVQAGADALGFVFVSLSPRVVTRKTASEILAALPPTVLTVGVVANENPNFLKELLRVCPLRALQFHGEEPPEEVLAFKEKVRLIKAIRVKGPEDVERIPGYQGVDAVLLDTRHPDKLGGTGQTFDWKLALAAKGFGIPIIVAGGLHPSNVVDCIQRIKPYGVDVTSGVELSPGKKDPELLRKFVQRAKQASA